jgi:hypothetical protein
MQIVITDSALKHGITSLDIRQMIYSFVRRLDIDGGKILFIGFLPTGVPTEIIGKEAEGVLYIFHAMALRKKYKSLLQ